MYIVYYLGIGINNTTTIILIILNSNDNLYSVYDLGKCYFDNRWKITPFNNCEVAKLLTWLRGIFVFVQNLYFKK